MVRFVRRYVAPGLKHGKYKLAQKIRVLARRGPYSRHPCDKLSSRDQVGCQRSLQVDQNPGIQGSPWATARYADGGDG